MSRRVVLIIDDDSQRTERFDFIVRLGGYEPESFETEAAALNWARYADFEGRILCILFSGPRGLDRTRRFVTTWVDSGKRVPVVLVRRGQFELNSLLAISWKDHFFVCEPEGVMQTLDILSAIEYDESNFVSPPKMSLVGGEGVC